MFVRHTSIHMCSNHSKMVNSREIFFNLCNKKNYEMNNKPQVVVQNI